MYALSRWMPLIEMGKDINQMYTDCTLQTRWMTGHYKASDWSEFLDRRTIAADQVSFLSTILHLSLWFHHQQCIQIENIVASLLLELQPSLLQQNYQALGEGQLFWTYSWASKLPSHHHYFSSEHNAHYQITKNLFAEDLKSLKVASGEPKSLCPWLRYRFLLIICADKCSQFRKRLL